MAEIASTTNEALLLDYALKTAKNDDDRLLYLGSALEELRGTFYRQAMFGEFEQKVHAMVDAGQAVTGEQLTKIINFRGIFQLPAVVYVQIALNHSIHHRGQLSMYLRPMGAKVPSIYGESYDARIDREAAATAPAR